MIEARDYYEALFFKYYFRGHFNKEFFYVTASSSFSLLNTLAVVSVVTPSSFVYGNSIDASRFVQLEEMACNFQPLNLTFQVQPAQSILDFQYFLHVSLYIFTPLFLCVHLSPSLFDVVPGHKQGAQQAAWLHCGHQDT